MLRDCRDAIGTLGHYVFILQPRWKLKAGRQFLNVFGVCIINLGT